MLFEQSQCWQIATYRPDLVFFDADIKAMTRSMVLATHTNMLVCQIYSRNHSTSRILPTDAAGAMNFIKAFGVGHTIPTCSVASTHMSSV